MKINVAQIGARGVLSADNVFAAGIVVLTMNALYLLSDFYAPISTTRILFLALIFLIVCLNTIKIFENGEVRRHFFFYMMTNIFIIVYAYSMSIIFGGYVYFLSDQNLIVYVLLSVIFSYLIGIYFVTSKNIDIRPAPASLYLYFSGAILLFVATGALTFTPLPLFKFESITGESRAYSQSLTSFLGMGAVLFYLKSCRSRAFFALFWLFVSLFFLVLTVFGGARGDLLVALVVIFAVEIRKPSLFRFVVAGAVLTVGIAYVIQQGLWQDILVFNRFLYLFETGTLGERDRLVWDSFALMADEPICIVIGCGYNYFQLYYGYEFGLYPHNVFMELIITYGLIVTLPLIVMVLRGVWVVYVSSFGRSFVFYFALFVLGLAIKGGTLVNMINMPVLLFFAFAPSLIKLSAVVHGRSKRQMSHAV